MGGEGERHGSRSAASAGSGREEIPSMEGSSASAEVTRVSSSSSSLGSDARSRAVKVIPLQPPVAPSLVSQSAEVYGRWAARVGSMSAMDWLELLLPCTRWMRNYRLREYLQADLMAGITVGVMLVPQV